MNEDSSFGEFFATDIGSMRAVRDELLLSSDWTQLADSSLTTEEKALWVIFRQELRDYPEVWGINPLTSYPLSPNIGPVNLDSEL